MSATWNIDGVAMFHSSKFGIWPSYLVINELSYHERFKPEIVIFAGIWFGYTEPLPHLFVGVFKDSLKRIYNGIKVQLDKGTFITVRGIILTGTTDLPAKVIFMS